MVFLGGKGVKIAFEEKRRNFFFFFFMGNGNERY